MTADVAHLDRLACLAGRSWRAVDLPGGLTNHNVRVTTTDGPDAGEPLDLVVRCTQSDAGLLGIDRDAEHANTAAAGAAGVGAEVVEYRPDLGMLVIGHLGGRTLASADLADPGVLARAADAVRRLHAGAPFVGRFDMFARQATYRATVRERGFALPPTYDDHEDAWGDVRRALAVGAGPLVPCNNDLLAANFIDGSDDSGPRVWLIDYEYSGDNDAFFELGNTATECDLTSDQTDAWVEAYLRPVGGPTRADLARVRLQMLCSEYGWSLWGFIQAATSPLGFDFRAWGQERLDKAEAAFRGPDLPRLLTEVTGA
ncbi:phosphotransferase [Nocardioides dongxiaopingii]|uniref:phosphotransferase n=1 Tax=Nocardioides dongxiaopingii TaxID=2576036 RepID=UPI0010C7664B|nr:phosphotransferase [Nocardioides dongxiaopingii]